MLSVIIATREWNDSAILYYYRKRVTDKYVYSTVKLYVPA